MSPSEPAAPPRSPRPTACDLAITPAQHSGIRWAPSGCWTLETLEQAERALAQTAGAPPAVLVLDLSSLVALDTAGALMLARAVRDARPAEIAIRGGTDAQRALVEAIRGRIEPSAPPAAERRRDIPGAALLARIGAAVIEAAAESGRQLGFLGRLLTTLPRLARSPRDWPIVPFVAHLERAGVDATPLVGLLSLMIGGVLAVLGADLLARFGAEIFTVNLVSFAFLREFGVLLAAILVAGRSASAFAAEIGSMKSREEIDAMEVLGLDPLERLVIPRIAALVLALPLLTVVADALGLLGGAIVSALLLDISPSLFMARLQEATELRHFATGLLKAPIFAVLIGLIGCFQGLQVEGDAESVGRRTTRAVVQAIFAVILADAFFAVLLLEIGL